MESVDCWAQSVLLHSDRLYKGIETMAFSGQSKISLFWHELLIGHSYIFRGETPFADEQHSD